MVTWENMFEADKIHFEASPNIFLEMQVRYTRGLKVSVTLKSYKVSCVQLHCPATVWAKNMETIKW